MFKNRNSDKQDRFKVVFKEGSMSGCKILVDTKTGVNYLYTWDGYSGGLTPLLNSDGSIVVTEYNE